MSLFYPEFFRGNHLNALKDAYDVFYRINIVDKVAGMLNIATAGKTLGRSITEIAYAQYSNPSMKLSDGFIEGLDKLQNILTKSHGLGGFRFRIIVEYEKFQTCNNGLWDYDDWAKCKKTSDIYENDEIPVYMLDSARDMKKLKFDVQKAMITFPQTIKF